MYIITLTLHYKRWPGAEKQQEQPQEQEQEQDQRQRQRQRYMLQH